MAYGTATVPRVDKIVGPGNQYVAAAKALVAADCAIDFYAGPTEIVIVSDKGNPEWIAADLIAQAEHDPHARAILITTNRRLALEVARAVDARRCPRRDPRANRWRGTAASSSPPGRQEAIDLANRAAAEHLVCDDDRFADARARGGIDFRRTVHGPGRRRLRDRIEPRPADQRRSAISGRPPHGRLRAHLDRPADDAKGITEPGADGHDARSPGRPRGARAIDRGAAAMTYVRPAGSRRSAAAAPQREHRRVLGGRARGYPPDFRRRRGVLPDYSALSRECAEYLGVREAQLVLTNGLDEGLLALTVSAFGVMQVADGLPEAIVPTPAFEMYSVFVKAAGGRVVAIPPKADFAFQTKEICDAVTDRTRILFLTNPEQSNRPADSARRHPRNRALPAERSDDRPRRGVLRLLRRNIPARDRRAPERRHRTDVRQGPRPGGPACRDASSATLIGSKRSARRSLPTA